MNVESLLKAQSILGEIESLKHELAVWQETPSNNQHPLSFRVRGRAITHMPDAIFQKLRDDCMRHLSSRIDTLTEQFELL